MMIELHIESANYLLIEFSELIGAIVPAIILLIFTVYYAYQ